MLRLTLDMVSVLPKVIILWIGIITYTVGVWNFVLWEWGSLFIYIYVWPGNQSAHTHTHTHLIPTLLLTLESKTSNMRVKHGVTLGSPISDKHCALQRSTHASWSLPRTSSSHRCGSAVILLEVSTAGVEIMGWEIADCGTKIVFELSFVQVNRNPTPLAGRRTWPNLCRRRPNKTLTRRPVVLLLDQSHPMVKSTSRALK